MNRPSKSTVNNVGNEDKERGEVAPLDYYEWWKEHYEIMTVAGIFAALSVYLSQFLSRSLNFLDPEKIFIGVGIAGGLLIFVILILQLVGEAMIQAKRAYYNQNVIFFLYVVTSVGLAGIVVAVVPILGKYSMGTEPLIDIAFSLTLLVGYIGYYQVNNPFGGIESGGVWRGLMRYSPWISITWMIIAVLISITQGENILLEMFTQNLYILGIVGLIGTHVIITLIFFLAGSIPLFAITLIKQVRTTTEGEE